MQDNDRTKLLETARLMEGRGDIDSAIKLFVRAGEPMEAARVMAMTGRHGEAGRLLLKSLAVRPDKVGKLDLSQRKSAYLAATYLAKGDDPKTAIQLYIGLGERERAAELLERDGDMLAAERLRSKGKRLLSARHGSRISHSESSAPVVNKRTALKLEEEGKLDMALKAYIQIKQFGDAGRIFRQQGKLEEAGKMFSEGGMPFEAASCYLDMGNDEKGLNYLMLVPREDSQYRAAAAKAVQAACKIGKINFRVENFLSMFVNTGVVEQNDMEAFYNLGALYEKSKMLKSAREVMSKIMARDSNFKDVAVRLGNIEQQIQASSTIYQSFDNEGDSFGRDSSTNESIMPPEVLPGLPPLSELLIQKEKDKEKEKEKEEEYDPGFVPGNLIANRYRIDTKIGQGGMAMVFKATDLELEEEIALKVFRHQLEDPNAMESTLARFKQELKLSRQLQHPNVIRLYDIGMHRGHRYITMELLIGASLEDLMTGPMELTRGLGYLIQASAGLYAAHKKGVIHRDVKPDNLFVTKENMIKVMDFGIARSVYGRGVTVAGMLAGTPEYMAPEQITDFSKVDSSADIYSLGVVAYRMFTGLLPFQHDELTPLLMMHVYMLPIPPREHNRNIPPEMEETILRMMEKDPKKRFPDCKELARHLQQMRANYTRQK